jgi:hypothetical protein
MGKHKIIKFGQTRVKNKVFVDYLDFKLLSIVQVANIVYIVSTPPGFQPDIATASIIYIWV